MWNDDMIRATASSRKRTLIPQPATLMIQANWKNKSPSKMTVNPSQPKTIIGVRDEDSSTASAKNPVALEENQSPQRIDVHHHFIPPCYAEGRLLRATSDFPMN